MGLSFLICIKRLLLFSFSSFLLSPPHQILDSIQCPDHRQSKAPPRYSPHVSVCSSVCGVCTGKFGGQGPRICCGSVQWTGARQDVTFWGKLSQPHRPSCHQSEPIVPPPWYHFINTEELNVCAFLCVAFLI